MYKQKYLEKKQQYLAFKMTNQVTTTLDEFMNGCHGLKYITRGSFGIIKTFSVQEKTYAMKITFLSTRPTRPSKITDEIKKMFNNSHELSLVKYIMSVDHFRQEMKIHQELSTIKVNGESIVPEYYMCAEIPAADLPNITCHQGSVSTGTVDDTWSSAVLQFFKPIGTVGITIMEYLDTYHDVAKCTTDRTPTIDHTFWAKLFVQLYFLQKKGYIHRDLHLNNVMYNGTHVKLIDFGKAKPIIFKDAHLEHIYQNIFKSDNDQYIQSLDEFRANHIINHIIYFEYQLNINTTPDLSFDFYYLLAFIRQDPSLQHPNVNQHSTPYTEQYSDVSAMYADKLRESFGPIDMTQLYSSFIEELKRQF